MDDDEINLRPPILFRQQRFLGSSEYDQLAEERNEIVREMLERIQEQRAEADEHEQDAYKAVQNVVANFNRGENTRLEIDAFSRSLKEAIQEACLHNGIVFDSQLTTDMPTP